MDSELAPVLDRVARMNGFRCDAYKESCLRRRLAVRMRAAGVHTFADYAAVLDRDDAELQRLMETLTINVTNFYRNPETFDLIRADVLPRIRAKWPGPVECWSAGSASGEEPHTLAMLLAESDVSVDSPASHVWGTDIDDASLETARRGAYRAASVADLPAALRARFLVPGPGDTHVVSDEVRNRVTFSHLDLLRESPPAEQLHLILCRNVVIYFDRNAQQEIFARMADTLLPGAFLVLGKTETLLGPVRERFLLENVRERVYRRA